MINECLSFTDGMVIHFKVQPQVHSIALTIFHQFTKQVPFTEVDRIMLSSVCLYLACKIEYYHIRISDFARYYHENKKGPKKRKPFEEAAEQLDNEFMNVELIALRINQFDFNIDTPNDYLRVFRDRYILSDD